MGRAFEYRKERKFKRVGATWLAYLLIGKRNHHCSKSGWSRSRHEPPPTGADSTSQKENMPKDNIERAIKRATEKDVTDYRKYTRIWPIRHRVSDRDGHR